MNEPDGAMRLHRLFQLASPSLPVGGFAYSEGLETVIETGRIRTVSDVEDWIGGILHHGIAWLDVPVLLRLHAAWQTDSADDVVAWSRYLMAARETAERRAQERHIGGALAMLLADLEIKRAGDWRPGGVHGAISTFATLLALAADAWDIRATDTAATLVWTWLEAQVLAAVKLVPLGQTDGQRVLFRLSESMSEVMATAVAVTDDDIAGALPGATLASTGHEQLYSRLFRS